MRMCKRAVSGGWGSGRTKRVGQGMESALMCGLMVILAGVASAASAREMSPTRVDAVDVISIPRQDGDERGGGHSREEQSVLPPVFPEYEDGVRSVSEGVPAGTSIHPPFEASDPQALPLTFILLGEAAELFTLDQGAKLIINEVPDFERRGNYEMTLRASNGVASSDLPIIVMVWNEDEPGVLTISEAGTDTQPRLDATLSDADGGVNGSSWKWEMSRNGQYGWRTVLTMQGDTSSFLPDRAQGGQWIRVTVRYRDAQGFSYIKSVQSEVVRIPRHGGS